MPYLARRTRRNGAYDPRRRRLSRGYLAYHRYAATEQVLATHPRFLDFLRKRRLRDPKSASPATGTATTGSCLPGNWEPTEVAC